MPAQPPDPTTWVEYAGSFVAGILGLRGLQVFGNRKANGHANGKTLTDVCDAIHSEGIATREVLSEVRSDLRVLLDRQSRVD